MPRVLIIGLGLIGGSLGLELKSAYTVTGYARRPEVAARALERGAVDRVVADLYQATREADLVVIATPILAVREVLTIIAPHLAPGSVVTDVASTKEQVMAWARELLPPSAGSGHRPAVSFVGGHPMAGKETWGLEVAEPGLFRGCTYCLVPGQAPSRAVDLVKDMALAVGARPLLMEAGEHDRLVAGISHLPLVLAAALVRAATDEPAWPRMAPLAAGGFRDTSRVASGSPEMGRDICLTNGPQILAWLDRFSQSLEELRRSIGIGDGPGLERRFREARQARESWLKERYG